MSKAVEIKNLTFRYEESTENIFENINFDLSYGKISLLSGVSGFGKSTLSYLINGIIPNLISGEITGEILINGKSNKSLTVAEISKEVGTVLQNAEEQIIKPIVEDEIAFGCENLGLSQDIIEQQIDSACQKLLLNKFDKTATLSGGQKQRLITATTLAMGPKIIILDEPLANLDQKGTKQLMETLKDLAKDNHAILIVEHRIDEVIQYVDDVWEIKNHQVCKVTNKEEYLKNFTNIISDTSKILPTTNPLFNINHIEFSPKHKTILKDINFSLNKGERLVILGDNGCGKTTITKIITRLLKPTNGYVDQYIDKSFKRKTKGNGKWFKKIGYVFQNPNYQLFMPSVEKEILFSGYSLGDCQKIVDLLSIGPLLNKHPHSLSEGQKRKVSLASILASRPEVLVLDEPTVGQDYQGLNRLCSVLNRIHDENNNTMITITHDKRCAEALCDKAIIIKDGVISQIGGKELVREYFKYKMK